MKHRCVESFSKRDDSLLGHAIAVRHGIGDEVVLIMSTREAVARVAPLLGFYDIDMRRAKHVSITEIVTAKAAEPGQILAVASSGPADALRTAIERVKVEHRNAVESAAYPSSKPHREANRAFLKRLAEIEAETLKVKQERDKQWTVASAQLPDVDTLVLALNDDDVWPGYFDGTTWRYVDAMPITAERVTHWAPLPSPPVARSPA